MPIINNYKFTRPFTKDGKESKWHQVVEFIKSNGPISKREIIEEVWGSNALFNNIRGYQSSLFAKLNKIHPEGVYYDKDLKKWTVYKLNTKLNKTRNNMNDYVNKLIVAQCVVEELKNKNRASYSNAFVTVINAINGEIVESLKESIK